MADLSLISSIKYARPIDNYHQLIYNGTYKEELFLDPRIPDLLVGAERSELVMTQFSCGHVVAHTLAAEQQPSFSRHSKLNAPHAPRLLVL